MIVKISRALNSISPKWVVLLSNGRIFACSEKMSLENNTLVNTIKILKTIINNIEVGNVFIIKELVIFRVAFNFFIFVKGMIPKNLLKMKFEEIHAIYNKYQDLDAIEKLDIKKEGVETKIISFSMALDVGPHPVFYIPQNFNSELAFKICMKSMLLLQIESEGAKTDMISFQPFVDLDSLGIVLTFQIEDDNARGGAYDAALTVLVDYETRALIYEKYQRIENLLNNAKNRIVKEYYAGNENFSHIFVDLKNSLSDITFEKIKSEDLKAEMIEQIKNVIKT